MQTGLIVYLSIAVLINIVLLVFLLTRQDRSRAIFITILNGALGIYTVGYLLEIMSTDAASIALALKVENIGIPLLGPFYLLTIVGLLKPKLLKTWMLIASLAYGAAMFQIVLLNDFHHLYYATVRAVVSDGMVVAAFTNGPLHHVQTVVSLLTAFGAYAMVIASYLSSNYKQRKQIQWIFAGTLISFIANVMDFSGLLPIGIDLNPFILTLTLICFAINLTQYNMLDIVTVASSTAVETMEDGLIVLDKDWCFQFSNSSANQLFPILTDCRRSEDVALRPDWPPELEPRAKPAQITFERKDTFGVLQYYKASITMIKNDRGTAIGWSIAVRNVTDMTVMINQMELLAITDPLTGIYNRRHFYTRVKQEMERAKRQPIDMSLIICDIDFFKSVNDTYGHAVGDVVLRSVVDTIKQQLRPYDIFARYGGEEFVVFATSGEKLDLMAFTERMRKAVEASSIMDKGKEIRVTASFGAVTVDAHDSIDCAFVAVDDALYQAKSEGRNRTVIGQVHNE